MKPHDNDNNILESQFIMRLPLEPARILHEAMRSGSSLKDRISIRIEPDMRHGEVRVDHWLLPAKVVDLPTIVESLKTIDGKGLYKTADICQMLLCRDEDDTTDPETESPQKTVKKKDSLKVDKKYLLPHGITPPMKNVRKRRFRKTLKKKYVEAPEIEKEVRRLLREDCESVAVVKWEIISEDKIHSKSKGGKAAGAAAAAAKKGAAAAAMGYNARAVEAAGSGSGLGGQNQNVDDDIHKIFGGAVSDSEDDDEDTRIKLEMDENSQNSADDSHLTDSNSVMNTSADVKPIIEFTSDMFPQTRNSPTMIQDMNFYQPDTSSMSYNAQSHSRSSVERRLEELQVDLQQIKLRCQQLDVEIETSGNLNLRQRLQDIRDRCIEEQEQKQLEHSDLMDYIMKSN